MTTIYCDLDGTLADLYGYENWLALLRAENTQPYDEAKPLVNLSRLARALHKAQSKGYAIGVLSWGAKNASTAYDKAVENAKRMWLIRHLPSVEWNEIIVVAYGTPKHSLANLGDLLFDDEERNRNEWGNGAHSPEEIFEVLASL